MIFFAFLVFVAPAKKTQFQRTFFFSDLKTLSVFCLFAAAAATIFKIYILTFAIKPLKGKQTKKKSPPEKGEC